MAIYHLNVIDLVAYITDNHYSLILGINVVFLKCAISLQVGFRLIAREQRLGTPC